MPDYPTCPWCGAEATEWSLLVDRGRWACFSHKSGKEPWQSVECRNNVLEAEVERLRAELETAKTGLRQWRDDYRTGADAIRAGLATLSGGWSNAAILVLLHQSAPLSVCDAMRTATEGDD